MRVVQSPSSAVKKVISLDESKEKVVSKIKEVGLMKKVADKMMDKD